MKTLQLFVVLLFYLVLPSLGQISNKPKLSKKDSPGGVILDGKVEATNDTVQFNFKTSIITENGDTSSNERSFFGTFHYELSFNTGKFINYKILIRILISRIDNKENVDKEDFAIESNIYNGIDKMLTDNIKLVVYKPRLLTEKKFIKYKKRHPEMLERTKEIMFKDIQ
jgi:hypothetical protein